MKFEIHPSEVSDLVHFSPALSIPHTSDDVESMFAGISRSGLFMWVVSDATINIYHVETSEWFGGYSFRESLKNPSAKITAVAELCSSHISFPCLLIAVNDDDETLICLYNINISKVIRSILVNDTVLKIGVVSSNGGACMETHHLLIQLRYLFGIIALGTAKGHVYFLDLCLDENYACDEHLPNLTFLVNKYELLPEKRERTLQKKQHILMLLNDKTAQRDSFEFESRNLSVGPVTFGKIQVSALKYIQSTVTLAVGFNYGGIQLWELTNLCLLYSVSNQAHELPIISFAFQEPENDPRNFCYLWIVTGFSANESPEDFSIASMYSLNYARRTFVESFGNLYTDLQSCSKRFEFPLTNDTMTFGQSSSSAGSCILSCQTVSQTEESYCLDRHLANDSDTGPENTSLCFLSWLVWSNTNTTPSSCHLAVFDLNQWYQAQMPFLVANSDPLHLNPYFAHYSLQDVIQNMDYEPLMGLYAVPHSIKKFKFISPAEEFFYPSSLDFQTIAYATTGICKASFMGLQRSLLYDIAEMGSNVLSNPKEFYSDLVGCGLVSDVSGNSDQVPLIVQRETILELNLEYHMPFFFMKCLNEWRYADSIQEGCTSRALLNWAWKKVFQIKSSIDKLNVHFFNCAGSDVDKASLKCLYSYRRQLDLIDTILMGYQKYASPRTDQGLQELKCRRDTVSAINMYLQVVLWLRSVRVLPEVSEGDETDKNVLYPVSALVNSYAKRRSNLQKIHSSIGPTDILLIDGLVKEAFSDNTWQEKGGNGIYPPPSIYATLSCYLLDEVPLEVKHSLMYYVLLDVCNAPQNKNSSLIYEVEKFPSVFSMPQNLSKLVEAFWYLDQFNFEAAINTLLHPAVKTSDILPWQHNRVIKCFLFQKEVHKALKYINHMDPPENTIEDMKLHLSVLLSRGAITEAFDYQRSKQSQSFCNELLHHLFLGCKETHRLKDVMYLPLNAFESSALVQFLSECEDPRAQEALVMYYLLRCNYFEAAKINKKLSMNLMGRSKPTHDRTAGRDALVDALLSSVPKTEQNLVDEVNRFQSIAVQKEDHLKPLSLSIKSAPLKQISYSDILNSLISGASSDICEPYLEPKTPLKSGTRSFFDRIPFLRPPLTPEKTRTMSTEAVFNTPVTKRALVSPSSEYSSPNKKSRLLDNVSFRTGSLLKKKIPKHLAGDVATLLQSPPIHRRGSKTSKDTNSQDSVSAPQGILKKAVESVNIPAVLDKHISETPSLISEDDESVSEVFMAEKMELENEVIEDDSGRQIRFSVPASKVLNTSAMSSSNSKSGASTSANEPLKSSQNLKDFESDIGVNPYESGDRICLNVSRQTALLFLAREGIRSNACDSEVLASNFLYEPTLKHSVGSSVMSLLQSTSSQKLRSTQKNSTSHVAHSDEFFSGTQCEPIPKSTYNSSSLMPVNVASSQNLFLEKEGVKSYESYSEVIASDTMYEAVPKSTGSSSSVTSSQITSEEEKITQIAEVSEASSDVEIIDYPEPLPKNDPVQDEPMSVPCESPYVTLTSGQPSSKFDLESGWRPVLDSECVHLSTSSSDNSGYSSASDRSLIVTPRKPLRDSSLNNSNSDLSRTSTAIEKDDTIGASSEVKQAEDIDSDVCIIEHISQDAASKDIHDGKSSEKMDTNEFEEKQNFELYDISENVPMQSRRTMPSIKQIIDDHIVKSLSQDHKDDASNASSSATSVKFIEEFDNELQQKTELNLEKRDVCIEGNDLSQSAYEIPKSIADTAVSTISEVSNESSLRQKVKSDDKNGVYNFAGVIPQPTVPAYIPLRERIKSSNTSLSEIEKADSEDLSSSSTSSKNKLEGIHLDYVFRVDKSGIASSVPIRERVKLFTNELESKKLDETDSSNSSLKSTKESVPEKITLDMCANELKQPDTEADQSLSFENKNGEPNREEIMPDVFVSELKNHDDKEANLPSEVKAGESVGEMITSSYENKSKMKNPKDEETARLSKIETDGSVKDDVFTLDGASAVRSRLSIKERIRFSAEKASEILKADVGDNKSVFYNLTKEKMGESDDGLNSEKLDINSAKSSPNRDKSETESCDAMDTDETTKSGTVISVPHKDFSQKLSERFDFISRHSDILEKKGKLYLQSMEILQEDEMPDYPELKKPKSARKTRTFVFSTEKQKNTAKSKMKQASKTEEVTAEKAREEPAKDWKEFIESQDPESYQQFSQSIQKGISDVATLKNVNVSPDTGKTFTENIEKGSVSIFDGSYLTEAASSAKGKSKSTKKYSSKAQTSKSAAKKEKDKTPKKFVFLFSQPHSPASPEILEALSTPAEYQIGSYMFSPPLTRGRLRQKRNEDSVGSSFSSSMMSEVSFARSKKPPPVDPILEEIIAEQSTDPKLLSESMAKKKLLPKKAAKQSAKKPKGSARKIKSELSRLESLESSPKLKQKPSPTKSVSSSSSKGSPSHSMVLRQPKQRTDQFM